MALTSGDLATAWGDGRGRDSCPGLCEQLWSSSGRVARRPPRLPQRPLLALPPAHRRQNSGLQIPVAGWPDKRRGLWPRRPGWWGALGEGRVKETPADALGLSSGSLESARLCVMGVHHAANTDCIVCLWIFLLASLLNIILCVSLFS